MTTASWHGATLATSDAVVMLEGNAHFPADAVDRAHLRASSRISRCPWKGVAHYFDVVVDGEVNENAAWVYPEPSDAAESIRGRIAFWKGVQVR